LKNKDMEITTTIDRKVKVVFEASIRRHLKLEDSDGISDLPTTEIFEQLALMGAQIFRVKDQQSQLSPITHPQVLHQPHNHIFHQHLEVLSNKKPDVPQPSSPPYTNVADETASIGVDARYGGAATTVASLKAGHGSGNIDK
ncbi:hypothetical protein Tco_0160530, partial [Tanacetum coccineum]